MKRHRVAIIGCGNIPLTGYIPAVLVHPCFDLIGLCDVRPERLDMALKMCGRAVPSVTDYRSLITPLTAVSSPFTRENSGLCARPVEAARERVLDGEKHLQHTRQTFSPRVVREIRLPVRSVMAVQFHPEMKRDLGENSLSIVLLTVQHRVNAPFTTQREPNKKSRS